MPSTAARFWCRQRRYHVPMRTCAVVIVLTSLASSQTQGAVDLDAAVRSLPAAVPALAAKPDGSGFRRSPDGGRWAWLAFDRAVAGEGEDDRSRPVSLHLATAHGGEVAVERVAVAGASGDGVGPEWLPNGGAVLVVTSDRDASLRTIGRIERVDVATRAVARVLQLEGWAIDCIDVAADGLRLAVMVHQTGVSEGACELRIVDRDGAASGTFAVAERWGYGAAASWSPDQQSIAIATGAGLYFAPVSGGDVRRCCDVTSDAVCMGKPQWTKDGQHVLVAAGGGVVWARVQGGLEQSWTEAQLGGRVQAVALRPEAGVAAIVSIEDVQGGLVDVMLGAGHAKSRSYAVVQLLALDGGERRRVDGLRQEIVARGRWTLPYLPGITELLQ